MRNVLILVTVITALFALNARAGDDWKTIAELTAGGDAKEVEYSGAISKLKIECTSGSVIINTVVIRKGGDKLPFKVGARIESGKTQLVTVGDQQGVTGLRVSDDGRGTYKVRVRK